ncbi:MAG: LysR family transcriptional regulator [Beijerinckiaceae bacterium]|jgi:DNA-binding transcriptional LysR family regulator|nr:LysR family transcriptional regulator [Beijerinckiaceae bacterium]
MFDPVLLRSFLAVLDHGGFTKASHQLHATQSTISGHLRRLELQAGHRLIARRRGGSIAATAAGERFAEDARAILRLHEVAAFRLAERPLAGIVRLGMSDDFASGRGFTALLAAFAQSHPGVELRVDVASSRSLLATIADGGLDFALTKRPADNGEGELLARHDVVWVAGRTTVTTSPLRLVLFPDPCAYRDIALSALHAAGADWVVSYTTPSLGGLKAALTAGLGIAPLASDLICDDLRPVPPSAALPALGKVALFLHAREPDRSPTTTHFAALLRRHFSRDGRTAFPVTGAS